MIFAAYIKDKYGSKFYVKASNIRRELTEKFRKWFDRYDIIVMPALTDKPPKLPKNDMNVKELINEAFANSGITCIFNLLGLPALTIDYMKNKGNEEFCPVMIVGNYFEDHRVLQFARYVETLAEKNI